MKEIWKDIADFEELYQVSSLGRIKSKRYNKLLCPCFNEKGYLRVSLTKNHKTYTKKVHRLVAQAFIPNPMNKKEINHINDNKEDNRVTNLEWVSHEENMFFTRGKLHNYLKRRKLTFVNKYGLFKNGVLIKTFNGLKELKEQLFIDEKTIYMLLNLPKELKECELKIMPPHQ